MAPRSATPLTVGVVAPPGSAWVRVDLAGDIDIVGEPVLVETVRRLSGRPVRVIVLDLTAVTFAGSTLANFLDALHEAHPDAALLLHRPSPVTRLVVAATGLDRLATISDDPLSSAVDRVLHARSETP